MIASSIVIGLSLLVASPSMAGITTTVTIAGTAMPGYYFTPASIKLALGGSADWSNTTGTTHTSNQNQGIWATGLIKPTTTSAIQTVSWAGSFAYHCSIHTYMKGVVKVPVQVSATSGTVGTTFMITYAVASLPAGFTATIQKKVGSGSWKTYKTGKTGTAVSFKPSVAGTYSFRAFLVSSTQQTKPSPAATITVS
jgi:plastocyanin